MTSLLRRALILMSFVQTPLCHAAERMEITKARLRAPLSPTTHPFLFSGAAPASLQELCRVWQQAFLRPQGKGLEAFADEFLCGPESADTPPPAPDTVEWSLRFQGGESQIEIALCHPLSHRENTTGCEATLTLPRTPRLGRLLATPAFADRLASALLQSSLMYGKAQGPLAAHRFPGGLKVRPYRLWRDADSGLFIATEPLSATGPLWLASEPTEGLNREVVAFQNELEGRWEDEERRQREKSNAREVRTSPSFPWARVSYESSFWAGLWRGEMGALPRESQSGGLEAGARFGDSLGMGIALDIRQASFAVEASLGPDKAKGLPPRVTVLEGLYTSRSAGLFWSLSHTLASLRMSLRLDLATENDASSPRKGDPTLRETLAFSRRIPLLGGLSAALRLPCSGAALELRGGYFLSNDSARSLSRWSVESRALFSGIPSVEMGPEAALEHHHVNKRNQGSKLGSDLDLILYQPRLGARARFTW